MPECVFPSRTQSKLLADAPWAYTDIDTNSCRASQALQLQCESITWQILVILIPVDVLAQKKS